MRSHFVPAYDAWFDKWAKDWGEKNKVAIEVDHILAGELPAKWAAEVATGDGHDILGFTQSGAINVFNKSLVDVGDLVKQVGDAHGGWVDPLAKNIGMFEGDLAAACRASSSSSAATTARTCSTPTTSSRSTPGTTCMKGGTLLKEKGNPIGIAINQKSNDANNSWSGLLWSYGASYVKEDGKTVSHQLARDEGSRQVALELYKKTMTNEVLSWDDTGNNQMLASGRASWIQNPISSLRTIEKDNPELAKKIYISNAPAGPKGRFASVDGGRLGDHELVQERRRRRRRCSPDWYAVYLEAVKASQGYNQPILLELPQEADADHRRGSEAGAAPGLRQGRARRRASLARRRRPPPKWSRTGSSR